MNVRSSKSQRIIAEEQKCNIITYHFCTLTNPKQQFYNQITIFQKGV